MSQLHRIAELWWGWMEPMFLQVSLLILLVWVIDLVIRKWAWPQVRYALWLLVLLKLLIPPTWYLPSGIVPVVSQQVMSRLETGQVSEQVEQDRPGGSEAAGGPETQAGAILSGGETGVDPRVGPGPAPARPGTPWQAYAFVAWILGMAGFVSFLALRLTRLRRWHREQEQRQTLPPWFHELLVQTAERLGLGRLPAIVFSDQVVTPAVYGIFGPVMVLPNDYLESLSAEEAEHVLLHELAHLKRGDLWLHGLCLMLQIVYWFNPLLLLARKQIQHVREICCDLTVAGLLREKTGRYRQTLLNTARELLTESVEPGLGLLGVVEEPFRLVARLRWLERQTWRHRKRVIATAVLVAGVLIPCVLPMAGGGAESAVLDPNQPGTGIPVVRPDDSRSPAGSGGGDGELVYIKSIARLDSYFFVFRTDSERRAVSEMWLGDHAVSVREGARQIIVDLADSLFTYIDHEEETFTRAPLAVDLAEVLSLRIRRAREDEWVTGEVEDTGRTRKLRGKECREFLVTSWRVRNGTYQDQNEVRVWASDDFSFDLAPFDIYLELARRLGNRDFENRRELRKIRGIQMRLEMRRRVGFLAEKRIVDEVVEISRRAAPVDVFAPPAEYHELNRIRRLDF